MENLKSEYVVDQVIKTEQNTDSENSVVKMDTAEITNQGNLNRELLITNVKQEAQEIDMDKKHKHIEVGDIKENIKEVVAETQKIEDPSSTTITLNKALEIPYTEKKAMGQRKPKRKWRAKNVHTAENESHDAEYDAKRSKKDCNRPAVRSRIAKHLPKKSCSMPQSIATEETNSPEAPFNHNIEYCLTVTNLPNNWSFIDIKNYIDAQCGPENEIELLIKGDKSSKGVIRLSYQTKEECNAAMNKLSNKEIEGNKLVLEMREIGLDADSKSRPLTPDPTSAITPWKPDLDAWEIDPKGNYGLKTEFLESLGITLPLDKWVRVTNFRCEKSEMRDILELAGNVLMCSMYYSPNKYAIVMYSHPLEAVQAVSMLNSQIYYGLALKVTMDRSRENTVHLPKGLNSIGQGLGTNGRPLRNITTHYQRIINNRRAPINQIAFNIPEHLIDKGETFTVRNMTQFESILHHNEQEKTVTSTFTSTVTSTVTKATNMVAKTITKPTSFLETTSSIKTQNNPCLDRKPSPRPNFVPQNNQPRNFGPNFPNQRMGWNGPGPGPMGPIGPMHGPMDSPPSSTHPVNGPQMMQGPIGWPMVGPHGPMGGQQGRMNGPQGPMGRPMNGPQGPMVGTMNNPQGPMNGPQGPIGGPQRPMGGPMNGPQGPMGETMNNPPGTMGGTMNNTQGPMNIPQGPMNSPRGPMGGPQRPMGGPMNGPQGPMGGTINNTQGPMNNPQGPMNGPQGAMTNLPGPLNGPQGSMNGPQGPINGPQGPMNGPQGPMNGPQGPMRGPMGGTMSNPQGPMNCPQGPMTGPHGSMGVTMNNLQGTMGRIMNNPQGPMNGPQGLMGGPMNCPQRPMGETINNPQGLMNNSQGTMNNSQGPMNNSQGPMNCPQGPMAGPMQGPMLGSAIREPTGPMGNFGNEPVKIQLTNLPPSTTFQLLRDKMLECGEVVSIQLTSFSSVLVTFLNRVIADRCYQMYHGKFIEGHILEVTYVQ